MFTASDMEVGLYVLASFIAISILTRMLIKHRNEILRQLNAQAEQEQQRQELARRLAAHRAAQEKKQDRKAA